MSKKNLTLIMTVIIISLAIIIGAIIISNSKEEQRLEYYCKISQEKLSNIGCTSSSDCWDGTTCDLSLWKCIKVPTGEVCNDLEETDCTEPTLDFPIPITQQDCEKISGSWELKLIE